MGELYNVNGWDRRPRSRWGAVLKTVRPTLRGRGLETSGLESPMLGERFVSDLKVRPPKDLGSWRLDHRKKREPGTGLTFRPPQRARGKGGGRGGEGRRLDLLERKQTKGVIQGWFVMHSQEWPCHRGSK